MKTDDVLKAIAICACDKRCFGCPYFNTSHKDCVDALLLDSRDLIERQKAEIKEQDQAIINALRRMGQIRAEAIREFAERLCDGKVSNDPVVIAVKCAVKDMTEDTK